MNLLTYLCFVSFSLYILLPSLTQGFMVHPKHTIGIHPLRNDCITCCKTGKQLFITSHSSVHSYYNGRWKKSLYSFGRIPIIGTSKLNIKKSRTPMSDTFLSLSPSSFQASAHKDSTFVLTVVLWLSTFGIALEQRTIIGKALSAPIVTMGMALICANVGIIPFSSPIYSMVNQYLIPLAVPMLLYDSDLKRAIRDTGSLLVAFAVGAVATVVGTILTFPVLPLRSLGNDIGWKVACALAARHIGGAINFVAVAETLGIPASAVSASIAADNVVVALYFAFLFAISKSGQEEQNKNKIEDGTSDASEMKDEKALGITGEVLSSDKPTNVTLSSLAVAISVSALLVTLGRALTKSLLPLGTSALPMISMLTVIAATLFPKFFSEISSSGTSLGILFIQMFLASSGAAGSLALVLRQAPSLFLFSSLQIAFHFLFLYGFGRIMLRLNPNELYLASNANVGGPTTAAAMAQAKNWKRLVMPALLVGIFGYGSATIIALALGPILKRLPLLVT